MPYLKHAATRSVRVSALSGTERLVSTPMMEKPTAFIIVLASIHAR
jgi:hypothetical protein